MIEVGSRVRVVRSFTDDDELSCEFLIDSEGTVVVTDLMTYDFMDVTVRMDHDMQTYDFFESELEVL